MLDVVCNTSPLQYLYQLGQIEILPSLVRRVIVPPAVLAQLRAGRDLGVAVPDVTTLDWVNVSKPTSTVVLPLVTDLGPGETEVLALALESRDRVAVLDD